MANFYVLHVNKIAFHKKNEGWPIPRYRGRLENLQISFYPCKMK